MFVGQNLSHFAVSLTRNFALSTLNRKTFVWQKLLPHCSLTFFVRQTQKFWEPLKTIITSLRCLTFFACQFCLTFFACDCRRVFCYAAQSRCLFRSARGVPAALRLRRRGRALSARAPTAARSCESCARAELAVPRRCCACSARAAKEDSLFCASVSGN